MSSCGCVSKCCCSATKTVVYKPSCGIGSTGAGATGRRGPRGFQGPAGPQGPQGQAGFGVDQIGFSALLATNTLAVDTSGAITGWVVSPFVSSDPQYSDVTFNTTTGTFAVPITGRYSIKATINYSIIAALNINLSGELPAFIVQRTSPTVTDLVVGRFPFANLSFTVAGFDIAISTVLGASTVTLANDVELEAGDEIQLLYETGDMLDGVAVLLGADEVPIYWSMHLIKETPSP